MTKRFILASGSQTRAALLRSARVDFDVVPAAVDEAALFANACESGAPQDPSAISLFLAKAKATEVSERFPEALVLGGDQVLALGSQLIFWAADRAGAKDILSRLRGNTHSLHSAAALSFNGNVVWTGLDTASLKMRAFSAEYLETYLNEAGDALTASAGAYQIEGVGVNLFETVIGNHATILGLPLLPLLAELRTRGVIAE